MIEIIKTQNDTYILENDTEYFVFNKQNMYSLKRDSCYFQIKFLRYLFLPRTCEEIKKEFGINDYELGLYLKTFSPFLEIKEINKKVLLIGKTKVNIILKEELDKISNIAVILTDVNSSEVLKLVEDSNIVILSQHTKFSPLYDFFNEYCRKKHKIIFNILYDGSKFTLGPYLQNNGKDFFCYKCFKKREELNDLNKKEVKLKREILSKNNYCDEIYSYIMNTKAAQEVAFTVIKYIVNPKIFDHQGVYILEDKNQIHFVRIYPIPYCKICKNEVIDLYREKARFERSKTSEINIDFINIKYGIFRKLINCKTDLIRNDIYYYTIQIPCIFNAINDIYDGDKYEYNIAGGVSINRKNALGKALGEAVERYCLEAYETKTLFRASISDMKEKNNTYLKELQLFADWQYQLESFPYTKVNEKTKIFWTQALNLLENEYIYVPASFIYSRFKKVKEENSIGYLTTSGTAASVEFESAVLYGIYELIERDCTVVTWLQKLSAPKVKIDVKNIKNRRLLKILDVLQLNNIHVDIFYITLDLEIPCFMAIGSSSNYKLPSKLIGAGCRMNKDEALIRALEEVIQGCGWSNLKKEAKFLKPGKNFENIKGFRERVSLYARKDMEKELDFLMLNKKTIKYIEIQSKYSCVDSEYRECIKILYRHNLSVIVKDLTTTDVREMGFTAVKVLIPELQQIEANHNYRYLNCKRTKEIPIKLGYKNVQTDSRLYNMAPHPFP